MAVRTFAAVLHREQDLYVAECPEVGTVSQGYTIKEAVANLKEDTDLYLEEFPFVTMPPPRSSAAQMRGRLPKFYIQRECYRMVDTEATVPAKVGTIRGSYC
jgi:predicted RNase H-like HicB family nuclease